MAKDLICGMQVDEKASVGTSEYKGITYYFCSPGCKTTFDKEPEKYALPQKENYAFQHRH